MIGKIVATIPQGGEIQLVLDDNGELQCNFPLILNLAKMKLDLYKRDYSPSTGPFGNLFLNQLARDLNGEVEIEHKQEPHGEVIY